MLHFIAHDKPQDTDFFIRRHIFPGGYLPGLTETISLMAEQGLEILDIENLRRHYALKLPGRKILTPTGRPSMHLIPNDLTSASAASGGPTCTSAPNSSGPKTPFSGSIKSLFPRATPVPIPWIGRLFITNLFRQENVELSRMLQSAGGGFGVMAAAPEDVHPADAADGVTGILV